MVAKLSTQAGPGASINQVPRLFQALPAHYAVNTLAAPPLQCLRIQAVHAETTVRQGSQQLGVYACAHENGAAGFAGRLDAGQGPVSHWQDGQFLHLPPAASLGWAWIRQAEVAKGGCPANIGGAGLPDGGCPLLDVGPHHGRLQHAWMCHRMLQQSLLHTLGRLAEGHLDSLQS